MASPACCLQEAARPLGLIVLKATEATGAMRPEKESLRGKEKDLPGLRFPSLLNEFPGVALGLAGRKSGGKQKEN